MKRVLLGLFICCFVLISGGAVFAAVEDETVTHIDPDPDDFKVIGAVGDPLVLPHHDSMTQKQREALQELLDEFNIVSGDIIVASITFIISKTRGSVTIIWENGQFIYNVITGAFDSYNDMNGASEGGMEALSTGSGSYIFVSGCEYDVSNDPAKGSFIAVKLDVEEARRKSSGGCSTFQIGAIVLFILPALALFRRRKK